MPVRDTEIILAYPIYDSVTGDYTTDSASNHTYELLADGVEVAVADTGSATTITGWNQVTIAADENTGTMMTLKITTSTNGIRIPAVTWDNSAPGLTVVQSDGGYTEAAIEFAQGAAYDGLQHDKKTFSVVSATDITSHVATLTVVNEHGRTMFTHTATPTHVTGTTYSVAFSVTAANTAKLNLSKNAGTYAVKIVNGSSIAMPYAGNVKCIYNIDGRST